VRANNPLAIALKESVIIWPGAGRHDLLVSIGIGSIADEIVSENNCKNTIRDSAVPRLVRAFMASLSMDGEQGFFEALNFVPDYMRADIHRLDYVLSEHLPRLDDVSKLTELSTGVGRNTFRVIQLYVPDLHFRSTLSHNLRTGQVVRVA
jgi:hypothetical protein